MAGGTIQLLAYGAEDVYLTSTPQITLFKTVYRRYTDFSIETIENSFSDDFDFGKKSTVQLFRLADLATQITLKITVSSVIPNDNSNFAWVKRLGHAIIKSIKIDIGGYTVDKQYGEWLDIWWELAREGNKETGYMKMIGDVSSMTSYNNSVKPQYDLFIPLKFWFNRYQGLALPLIAIQYHTIMFTTEFASKDSLIITSQDFTAINDITMLSASLLINYVHLGDVERRKFSLANHDYLIEQIQSATDGQVDTAMKKYRLYFNYPTKEFIWMMKNGNYTNSNNFLCYTDKEDWSTTVNNAAYTLLNDSILLLDGPVYEIDQYGNYIILVPGENPPAPINVWEPFLPLMSGTTVNGKITVHNNSDNMTLWVNTQSLTISGYSLTNSVNATITVNIDNTILIENFLSTLSIRDVSIPINLMTDTRADSTHDVTVNQFNNYGLLINGQYNPVQYALLEFNDQERFVKRNGLFFNYLQPEMHHSNTPADGINVYSFSIWPEKHQPSGTANLSKIEVVILSIWFNDPTKQQKLPDIGFINKQSTFYVFGVNYNIFKVMNGLTAVMYTD
jgi:hypothetical protein